MRDWPDQTTLPPHGPLLEAAMGAPGLMWPGGTTSTNCTTSTIYFVSPHNLNPGQAVVFGSEMRFVAAVVTPQVVIVNAPFSSAPATGIPLGPTRDLHACNNCCPASACSITGTRSDAVQRILPGVGVDRMTSVHERRLPASLSFPGHGPGCAGQQRIVPGWPGWTGDIPRGDRPRSPVNYALVPGNLGEVWMGVIPNQMFTVTQASVEIKNNLGLRGEGIARYCRWRWLLALAGVTMNLEFFSHG